MNNPWLSIPFAEYETHMSHPDVLQSQFLGNVFADVIHTNEPRTIAILGCATGNGLEHVEAGEVDRIVAVDVNPEYIDIARDRHAARLPELELVEADILDCDFASGSFGLIHCALLLEYVDPLALIPQMARWLTEDGDLVVVLQLASPEAFPVSETGCESLKLLEPVMRLHEPDGIAEIARSAGLIESVGSEHQLASGKRFYIGHFRHSRDLRR